MRRAILLAGLIAGTALAATRSTSHKPRPAAPVARDWTQAIAVTPAGAYVMGNPAAKLKIVEYLSLTCSHCAAFDVEAMPTLTSDYIRTGTASLEVRHAIRDRYDFVAAILARCGGPRRYFATADLMFHQQADWFAKAAAWEQSGETDLTKLAPADAFAMIADKAGLMAIAAQRGTTPAQAKACFADPQAPKTLAAMRDEAWDQRKISGTPAFLVNGATTDAHDWPTLEAALKTAAGG